MNQWSLALTALLGACGMAAAQHQPAQPLVAEASQVGEGPLRVDVQPGPNPWTHLNIEEDPNLFHFAIVSDNTGRARAGVFRDAMVKLNWMRPKFVLSIGDLIQGHNQVEPLQRQWDAFLK